MAPSSSAGSMSNEGMRLSGFTCWLARIQAASAPRSLRSVAAPSEMRLATCVRSGPRAPFGCVPRMRVADAASALDETRLVRARFAALAGDGRGLALLRPPRVELGRRHRDDEQRHARVRAAAILGALAAKLAGPVGRQHEAVHATGNHVELAAQGSAPRSCG